MSIDKLEWDLVVLFFFSSLILVYVYVCCTYVYLHFAHGWAHMCVYTHVCARMYVAA